MLRPNTLGPPPSTARRSRRQEQRVYAMPFSYSSPTCLNSLMKIQTRVVRAASLHASPSLPCAPTDTRVAPLPVRAALSQCVLTATSSRGARASRCATRVS